MDEELTKDHLEDEEFQDFYAETYDLLVVNYSSVEAWEKAKDSFLEKHFPTF